MHVDKVGYQIAICHTHMIELLAFVIVYKPHQIVEFPDVVLMGSKLSFTLLETVSMKAKMKN